MATFDDSGIHFEYTLASRVVLPQPQPQIERRTIRIDTPLSVFSATVRATALNGAANLVDHKWRAGFIQEISSSSRIGHYAPDVRTEDRIWEVPKEQNQPGRPIRDSRGGELPYDGHSEDLTHGVMVPIESDDNPVLELPLDLAVAHQSRTLTNITGGDRFTIWLAATKDEQPQRLVILGRIHWHVNWRAVVSSPNNTAFVPLVQLPVHDRPQLDIARGFDRGPLPLGYPQDLTDIEGNDFFYRITYHRGIEIHRGEVDSDPSEPSVALAKFPKKLGKAQSWWT